MNSIIKINFYEKKQCFKKCIMTNGIYNYIWNFHEINWNKIKMSYFGKETHLFI